MPPKSKAAPKSKPKTAVQFPPLGQHASAYKSKVYAVREHIFECNSKDPPRALADYEKLMAENAELARWAATHICMLRARATRGAWMKTTEAQRGRYALQLQRRLAAPNEPDEFVIE